MKSFSSEPYPSQHGFQQQNDFDEPEERHLTLGLTALLGIFFAIALICGLFFGFGYSTGRGHFHTAAKAGSAAPAGPSSTAALQAAPATNTSSPALATAPQPAPAAADTQRPNDETTARAQDQPQAQPHHSSQSTRPPSLRPSRPTRQPTLLKSTHPCQLPRLTQYGQPLPSQNPLCPQHRPRATRQSYLPLQQAPRSWCR